MNKTLKTKLCNNLIENGKVKEFDVIKHSYSTARMKEWEERNIENNNISPTLDTRCDCLGVVVNLEPKVIGGIGEKKSNGGTQYYQQDKIYDDNVAISITTAFNPYYSVNRGGANKCKKILI